MTFALLRRLARFCANTNEAGVRRSSSSDRNCDPENGSLVRPVKLHRAAIPVGDDVIRVAHEYRVMREVERRVVLSVLDRKIFVTNRDAILWTRKLLDEERLFAGVSSGAIARP